MSSAPQPKHATRVVGLDVARGALMAYIVILIHGVFWLGLLPQPWSTVLLFEMPPIFAITGAAYFYAEHGAALTPGSYASYIARRFVRILAPYFAYVLVAAAIVLALNVSRDPVGALSSWLNPNSHGAGHTTLMLSWHLWFVPPFLAVTALLPFLTRIPAPRLPLWVWALAGGAVVYAATLLDPTRNHGQTIVFYALWALFGFGLAAAPGRYKARSFVLALALALAAMAALSLSISGATLDMQTNKFPPNLLFYAFSCAWMAALLIMAMGMSGPVLQRLAASPLLKPFITSGYSIYLWQGLGYSAAAYVLRPLDVSPWLIWPVAVVLTVTLGLVASPLERLRFPRRRFDTL